MRIALLTAAIGAAVVLSGCFYDTGRDVPYGGPGYRTDRYPEAGRRDEERREGARREERRDDRRDDRREDERRDDERR